MSVSNTTVLNLLKNMGIQEYMDRPGVTEVAINQHSYILTESSQGWEIFSEPRCTYDALLKLANALAIFNGGHITPEKPILSVTLPYGQRGQIVVPPACEADTVSLTIRIPSQTRFTLNDYIESGRIVPATNLSSAGDLADWEKEMVMANKRQDWQTFFRLAVDNKLNLVTVGGTGSGKTTFSKAIADLVPPEVRLFTLEDTPELTLPNHPNHVHLFYRKNSAAQSPKILIESCMRMKPDRVFLTELRSDEAWDYINLLNTGHPGSLTSVHANSGRETHYRVAGLVKQSGVGKGLDFDFVLREIQTTLDVICVFKHTYLRELVYEPERKHELFEGKFK